MAPDIQWPAFKGYVPLSSDPVRNQIRLLDMEYDARTKQIDCKLIHHDLGTGSTSHAYSAMSYYWGSPGRERAIRVHGEQVMLRKSVYDFLKALGRRFGTIRVWLDVLCINQHDPVERSQQVALMREIFARAGAVYSWLGKGNTDTDLLLETFDRANADPSESQKVQGPVPSARLLAYTKRLLAHPYFTRLWIIQECAMARKLYVVCGPKMVDRQVLLERIQHLGETKVERQQVLRTNESHDRQADLMENAKKILGLRTEDLVDRRSRILDIMDEFSAAECQDARDKVFGLRGLARELDAISVDYNSSRAGVLLSTLGAANSSSAVDMTSRLSDTKRLLRHLCPTFDEIRLEIEYDLVGVVGRKSKLVNLKAPLDGQYLGSDIWRGIWTSKEPVPAYPADEPRYSYFWKEPRFCGCLPIGDDVRVYPFIELSYSVSVALALKSDEKHQLSVIDLGLFYRSDAQLYLFGSRNHAHPLLLASPSFTDDMPELRNLCIPGGFELCKKGAAVHFSPVVLFASLTLPSGDKAVEVWNRKEKRQMFEMLKACVQKHQDSYRFQRLCFCT